MKPLFFRYVLACLIFAGFPGTGLSSDINANPSDRDYTLPEVCRIASKTAEQIKISENDHFIAKQDKKRALSVLMPRATTFGSSLAYREPDQNNPDMNAWGVKLNQSFTLNGKELIALNIAGETIREKGFALKAVKSDYILQVSQAFYRILSAKRHVEIARSDVKRLEKHRHAVNERLNVGQVTKTALFRAEAELSGAKTALVQSSNGLNLARASLERLVNLEENFTLSEGHVRELDNFVYSFEALKTQALEHRAEIQAAETTLAIAEKSIRYTKGAYWPTLSVEGTYSNTRIEFDQPVHTSSDTENSSIEANLTFTLFDGGLRSADVSKALADRRKADLALQTKKKGIVLEAKSAWLDYRTAVSVARTLEDELTSARENFKAVQMQFKHGMADSVDMMDANTLLVKAQRNLSDAQYSRILSILGIMRTRGDIVSVLGPRK